MTAVARPPRAMAGTHATPAVQDDEYVGKHRRDERARHAHAAAAVLAVMLAWIPPVAASRGRHRR